MDLDFGSEDMMSITWEKCPGCRWRHHPENKCPPVLSPDEEKEDEDGKLSRIE